MVKYAYSNPQYIESFPVSVILCIDVDNNHEYAIQDNFLLFYFRICWGNHFFKIHFSGLIIFYRYPKQIDTKCRINIEML